MSPAELSAILAAHSEWLRTSGVAGRYCDIRGADLGGMDLRRSNFERANLSRCNFERADLRGVICTRANLAGANLHRTRLTGASFRDAVLNRIFAAYVDFKGVNLIGTSLVGADMTNAMLDEAIWGDDEASRLAYARLSILPAGDIIGWKKLAGGEIAKLLIPAAAGRSNSFGRLCRAEFARVLSIIDENGRLVSRGRARKASQFEYAVGETASPETWDERWQNVCSGGIHFFITYEEAAAL